MSDEDDVKRLKLTVRSDWKIDVEHTIENSDSFSDPPILLKLNAMQKNTIDVLVAMLRENRLNKRNEFEVLGSNLYSVLFDNDIGKALTKLLSGGDNDLLRVELEFEKDGTYLRELASWPWEYLFCPALEALTFLSETTKLVLTRHLKLNQKVRKLLVDEPPIKVLFVSASPDLDKPDGKELNPIQYTSVYNELKALENTKKIKVHDLITLHEKYDKERFSGEYVLKATFDGFINLVTAEKPHVIHFIGHGRMSDENGQSQGQIAFMAPDFTADWVNAGELATKLIGIDPPPRLVFLQACESGLTNPYDPYLAISSVAERLVYRNIPAVVAMQSEIENQIANVFAKAFYGALFNAKSSVDAAMQIGRTKVLEARNWAKSRAFGLPVLYLRGYGGLLSPEVIPGPSSNTSSLISGISNIVTINSQGTTTTSCPWCQNPVEVGEETCVNCGGVLFCPNPKCRRPIRRRGNYCSSMDCKQKLPKPPDEE